MRTAIPDDVRPEPGEFRGFYREHYGFVCHVVGRFGVGEGEHGDAVQDTFIAAYRRLGTTRPAAVRPWLYGIARRVASNYRRGARRADRKRAAIADAGVAAIAPATADALHVLDQFLAQLDERDRELFVLSELLGISGQELAASLGLLPRVVYARLRLLRLRLAEAAPEGLFAALCRVRADEPQATARGWMLLAPLLPAPPSSLATLAGSLGLGKLAAITGAAVLAVGVVALRPSVAPDDAGRPAAEVVAAPATAAASSRAAASARPVAEPTVDAPATAIPVVGDAAVRAGPPAHDPSRRDTAVPHVDAAHRSSAAADPHAQVDALARRPTLAADNEALRAIIDALGEAQGARAEALALAHAREFPDSPQADLREALRIEALCLEGQASAATAAARALAVAHPGSPALARVRRSCAAP